MLFLCCTYRQVSSRRHVPLSDRIKGVSGSKMPRVMNARSYIRAYGATTSVASMGRGPVRGVARAVCAPMSSLRHTTARLKMLERRTTARFLHISPRPTSTASPQRHSELKHGGGLPSLPPSTLHQRSEETLHRVDRQVGCSVTAPRTRRLPYTDREKEFHSRYIFTAEQSKVRHSARLVDAYRSNHLDKEDAEDVSRTFIRRRFSQRSYEDDGQNFRSAGKPEKTPWRTAVLQQSDDGIVGRFVIRRSQPQSTPASIESGRRSSRSVDIYGPRYSSPVATRPAQSADAPSSAASSESRLIRTKNVSLTAENSGGDEHLLYRALSQSTVGSDWPTVCGML